MNIKHDEMEQKFTTIHDKDAFLAYNLVNNLIDLHVIYAGSDEVAEQLAVAAFEYARQSGMLVISSSAFIEGFVSRHAEYADLIGAY